MTAPSTAESTTSTSSPSNVSGHVDSAATETKFAVGLTLFAGVVLSTVGVFQFFQGLAAIIEQDFYVVTANNIYELSVSGWGWIHLILGVVLAVTGFFVLTGQPWARIVGIGVVAVSALANFLFIPYYPVWALIIIALDVAVIWALATDRRAAI